MIEAEENKRALTENHKMDKPPMDVAGLRGQPPMDVVGPSEGSELRRDKRYLAEAPNAAVVADIEVAKEHVR